MSDRRANEIMVRLSDEESTRLDELRPPGVKRATFFRQLLKEPPRDDEVATRGESLGILSRMARDGKVAAAIALSRELREEPAQEPEGELRRLLDE